MRPFLFFRFWLSKVKTLIMTGRAPAQKAISGEAGNILANLE
jgi:hypothetical protein